MCHGLNPFHTNNLTDGWGFVPMVNVMKVMNLKNCDKRLLWVEEKMNERRNFFCWNIQMHFIKKDNPKFYIHQHYCREFHDCISISQGSCNRILILASPDWIFGYKDPGTNSVSEIVFCPVSVITRGFCQGFPPL